MERKTDLRITTPDGKTIATSVGDMNRVSRALELGTAMEREAPYLAQLEANARRRREVLEEKREANKGWQEALKALDEDDDRALANLDAARKPLPLFPEGREGKP